MQHSLPAGYQSPQLCRPQAATAAGDHPSHSHLRLCVLDGRALPVQEAILGVNHLLGLAGLLKSRFQLHRHVLAHCRKENTGGLRVFTTLMGSATEHLVTGQQQKQAPGVGHTRATVSRTQTPQPFKEITGNGSTDSTGDPLNQERLNQCFDVSAFTQPAAMAQLGR